MTSLRHIRYEDIADFPKPGGHVPTAFQFSEDGRRVYYLFPAEGAELSLWVYDTTQGTHRLIARPPIGTAVDTFDEEMRRQRARFSWGGISHYEWQKGTLLIPMHGRLYVQRGDEELRQVPGVDGVVDPTLSPDGTCIYGVMEGNLCRIDPDHGTLNWLTPGAEEGVTYGLAEYAAQEELDRSHGYWVSPDGGAVALAMVDERHIPKFPIVHQDGDTVWSEEHRYPFVGQANAVVRLGIRDTEGSSQIRWIEWDSHERYLIDVLWTAKGDLLVLTMARSHQEMAWDRYDRNARHLRRVYEERAERWINRPARSVVLKDGTLLSSTERDGQRRLLRVTPDGVWHVVTPQGEADWAVLTLLAADEPSCTVYVSATRNRALERCLIAIQWDTGVWTDLTPEPGTHFVSVAPDASGWVDQHSDFDHAPETHYIAGHDRGRLVLRDNPVSRQSLDLARPELFHFAVDDGTVLNGLVYRPLGDKPKAGWPLIVSVYAGPHAQMVVNDWNETVDLQAQYLAQRGFMVMKLDSRGSFNRGPLFEQVLYHHFGDVELRDQVAGVHYVAEHWPVDLSRVGIFGWSYGGYMTLRALLMAPEVFSVGVAGAPVTDFRWYDTAYTERYLGTDETNHAGYEDSSLINKADRLQGKLLLIHGMVDENVHFRHSAALIQAFINAGKDFDLVVLPGSRHMVQGLANTLYRTRRTLQYFEDHL